MRYRISLFSHGCFLLSIFALGLARAQAQRPLGTDVSGYQTSVNWSAVKNAGVVFAWAKATEGTYYVSSPYFVQQEAGAKAAGIYIGAYHYARPSIDTNITGAYSADTEAAYFWSVAGNYVKYGGGYLVPMLDWEDPYATNGYTTFNGFTTAYMSQWVNEWCNTVSNYAAAAGVPGLKPVVYTGTWYSTAHTGAAQFPGLNSTVTGWANWMSDYSGVGAQTGAPTTTPWSSWKIWQYADTNWSGGDADVYNGNLAGFVQTFVIGGTNAPDIITNTPALTVAAGSDAAFFVQATGQQPLSFKWLFNGMLIPGATSSNYALANVQLTNAGAYTVLVSNSYASIPSSPAFLSVLPPLTNAPGSALAPASMINWWTADGNGLDLYGTNTLTPYGGLSYTNGKSLLAFHFDGSTASLAPNGATNIPPNWTLCLWINRQNAATASASLMGDSTYALKLEQYNGTREVGLTKSGVADYYFKCSVPQNQWTHLALVDSGSQISLYTNGIFVTSQLYSNSVAVPAPSGFPLPRACIGADLLSGSQTDYLLGSLDEIQTFHRALSGIEVAAIYAAGAAGLVRAPQFTGITPAANHQVQLSFQGLTGKSLNLYSSTNLVTWTFLGAAANPTGAGQYQDSTAAPQEFYRAVQP